MSEIRVTTISDTAGTGPVTLTKQHAAKVWCNFDADAPSIRDSFNTSSVTDGGNCDYTYNFTNNMGNVNYVPAGFIKDGASPNTFSRVFAAKDADTFSTGALQCSPSATNASTFTSAFDPDYVCVMIMGDLA